MSIQLVKHYRSLSIDDPRNREAPAFIRLLMDEDTERKVTIVINIDVEQTTIGYAVCSKADQFSKKIGRTIAAERSISSPLILPTADVMAAFYKAIPSGLLSSKGYATYAASTLEDVSYAFIMNMAKDLVVAELTAHIFPSTVDTED